MRLILLYHFLFHVYQKYEITVIITNMTPSYAHLQFQAKKNMAASMQNKLQIPTVAPTH